MSGDAENVRLWDDAVVYVSFDLEAETPANSAAAFDGDWELVGFLDGADGFPTARTQAVKDHFAWGKKLVKQSRKDKKVVKSFTALEANDVTRRLAWPGSDPGELKWGDPEQVRIAFETLEGDLVQRKISKAYALVEVDGDMPENDEDLAKTKFMVTIFPDEDGVYFEEQGEASVASIAIDPLTRAIGVGAFTHVTATATFSDATTQDITAVAEWSSSVPARATVGPNAVITGVGAGATNISCTYGGVTSTAPCVVTVS